MNRLPVTRHSWSRRSSSLPFTHLLPSDIPDSSNFSGLIERVALLLRTSQVASASSAYFPEDTAATCMHGNAASTLLTWIEGSSRDASLAHPDLTAYRVRANSHPHLGNAITPSEASKSSVPTVSTDFTAMPSIYTEDVIRRVEVMTIQARQEVATAANAAQSRHRNTYLPPSETGADSEPEMLPDCPFDVRT